MCISKRNFCIYMIFSIGWLPIARVHKIVCYPSSLVLRIRLSHAATTPRHTHLRCMVTGTRSAELRHCAGLSDYTPPEKKKQEVAEDTRDGALLVAVAERDGVGDAGGRSEQDVHMSDGENAYCEMLTRGGWGEEEAW